MFVVKVSERCKLSPSDEAVGIWQNLAVRSVEFHYIVETALVTAVALLARTSRDPGSNDLTPSGKGLFPPLIKAAAKALRGDEMDGGGHACIVHGHNVGRDDGSRVIVTAEARDQDLAALAGRESTTAGLQVGIQNHMLIDGANGLIKEADELRGVIDVDITGRDIERVGGFLDAVEVHATTARIADDEQQANGILLQGLVITDVLDGAEMEVVENALRHATVLVQPLPIGRSSRCLGDVASDDAVFLARQIQIGREAGLRRDDELRMHRELFEQVGITMERLLGSAAGVGRRGNGSAGY